MEMISTAQKLAKDNGFDSKGYRLIMNCEEWGGQTVFQLHMHMLSGTHLSGGFA